MPRHPITVFVVTAFELDLEGVSDHRAQRPAAGTRRLMPALALARFKAKVDVLAPAHHAVDCDHGLGRSRCPWTADARR